jgi:predicted alpha/beta-fold hydrolase
LKPALNGRDYTAPAWLPGGHAQTIWPLLIKGPLPRYRRERWDTPDDDFIDLDWIGGTPGAPCVALFPWPRRQFAQPLRAAPDARGARERGWHGVVVHFRGCSGEPNRLPRAYHSGDSPEIDWVVRRLHARGFPALFLAGVSLGGNAMLKWLAEQGGQACPGSMRRQR